MKDTKYTPAALEQKWYEIWEQQHYFVPKGKGEPYCIVLPPPNVTGTLHMGHGFQMSIMDVLIRYHRMCGDNTLWQVGTDHAGIATQMIVENQVRREGKTRQDLGRDAFIQRVWDWKKYSGGNITKQERRLGISGDWTREKFTLDQDLARAVQRAFIQLYNDGLIYRGKRLVNWDPILKTAISDLEVINEDSNGSLWHINYPVVGSDEVVTVATTRPETLFGDTAVAVHPDDMRYQHLIGKYVYLPLTERTIPIIADTMVEREFGTGCVKITPAHDFNDYATAKRHQLPMINILTADAHLNEQVPEQFRGLTCPEARSVVLQELTKIGALIKTEPHQLKIPKGDRSGAVIEPYLTDQWFVKMQPLAKPAIQALHEGKIRFIPENWGKTYLQWLENIEDWCISRQLWWGHRIPAWYDAHGNVYVGADITEVMQKSGLSAEQLIQDEDVLDTWFSSALWPFATLGWPEVTPELKTFYPTATLVTGFDIIFFWVARMIMFGLKFMGEVPFRDIYITGLIRDSRGQKMSKSKGNILDPIDLADGISLYDLLQKRTANLMQDHLVAKIKQQTQKEFPQGITGYGIDALRFTFCALATMSRDINFDMNRLEGYRNFCTKIWNGTRFALMQSENFVADDTLPVVFTPFDLWINAALQRTIRVVTEEINRYRFDLATQALYEFFWYQYCDWYLELVKPVFNSEAFSAEQRRGAQLTLLTVLESALRLLHPFMPFITEELWQQLAPKLGITRPSIMLEPYPHYDAALERSDVIAEVEWFRQLVLAIRNIRGEMNLASNKPLVLLLAKGNERDHTLMERYQFYLQWLAKLAEIRWVADEGKLPFVISVMVDDLELHLVMDGIDLKAELARLTKEQQKALKELDTIAGKLAHSAYVQKAPAMVVEKDRARQEELMQLISKLTAQITQLEQKG